MTGTRLEVETGGGGREEEKNQEVVTRGGEVGNGSEARPAGCSGSRDRTYVFSGSFEVHFSPSFPPFCRKPVSRKPFFAFFPTVFVRQPNPPNFKLRMRHSDMVGVRSESDQSQTQSQM